MSLRHYIALEAKLDSGCWTNLTPTEVAVLYVLAGFENENGRQCFPSVDLIATRGQMSYKSAQKATSPSGLPAKVGLGVGMRGKSRIYDLSFLFSNNPEAFNSSSKEEKSSTVAQEDSSSTRTNISSDSDTSATESGNQSGNESGTKTGEFPEEMFPEKLAHAWNRICGEAGAPMMGRLDAPLVKKIHARHMSNCDPVPGLGTALVSVHHWTRFFQWVAMSGFLMGRALPLPDDGRMPRDDGRPPFVATFYWLFQSEEPINKIRSGYYHRGTATRPGPQFEDMPPPVTIVADVEELRRYSPLPPVRKTRSTSGASRR